MLVAMTHRLRNAFSFYAGPAYFPLIAVSRLISRGCLASRVSWTRRVVVRACVGEPSGDRADSKRIDNDLHPEIIEWMTQVNNAASARVVKFPAVKAERMGSDFIKRVLRGKMTPSSR